MKEQRFEPYVTLYVSLTLFPARTKPSATVEIRAGDFAERRKAADRRMTVSESGSI